MFKKMAISLAVSVGMRLLKSLSTALWNSFWDAIFEGVQWAEKRWIETGRGSTRKEYVVTEIMDFLNRRGLIKWGSGWLIRIFVEKIVDEILDELNKGLGHDWVKKVTEVKLWFEAKYNLEDWVNTKIRK